MGRPPKLTPYQWREAIRRRDGGETLAGIGRIYNVSGAAISRHRPWHDECGSASMKWGDVGEHSDGTSGKGGGQEAGSVGEGGQGTGAEQGQGAGQYQGCRGSRERRHGRSTPTFSIQPLPSTSLAKSVPAIWWPSIARNQRSGSK